MAKARQRVLARFFVASLRPFSRPTAVVLLRFYSVSDWDKKSIAGWIAANFVVQLT